MSEQSIPKSIGVRAFLGAAKAPSRGALLALCCALVSSAVAHGQQTFNALGQSHLVQSITFYPSQFPYGPTDFGSIDIVFTNGVERAGIGLESGILLIDEHFGLPAFPACSCLGFNDPDLNLASRRDYFIAYYYIQAMPNNPFGEIMDGLLIRQKDNTICVNAIRRTTYPIDVVTVFDEHDCLEFIPIIGPSPAALARLKHLLEDVELPPDRVPPIKWPGPFCLTCPPWSKYEKQRARFAQMHEAHVRQELQRVVEVNKTILPGR